MPKIVIEELRIVASSKEISIDDILIDQPSKHLYVGRTGQGKTLLLKTLMGLNVFSGVKHTGKIITEGKTHYIPQEPWIVNIGSTGYDEILLHGRKHEEFNDFLSIYDQLLSKKINEMSYGEKRLLEIIKALIIKPDIYFLDEPLEALDTTNREQVIQLLEEYMNDKIIIATSKKPIKGKWIIHNIHNKYKYTRNTGENPIEIDPIDNYNGLIHVPEHSYIKRGRKRIKIPEIKLKPGDTITIYGPNGSGKTSILLGLAGAIKVKGNIRVKGSIGIVPDHINILYPWATLSEVLTRICGLNKRCINVTLRILETMHVEVSGDKYFYEYSDGEKRLILLIAQLVKGVDILLLDGGLEYIDHDKAMIIEKYLKNYLSNGGILISTLPRGDELYYEEKLHLFND